MSKRQRLAYLAVAAAIAVVAVVVLRTGGDEKQAAPGATADPTATATAGTTPQAAPDPEQAAAPKLPLLDGRDERVVEARQGELVRFHVRSDADDEVHVHGYDVLKPVRAGRATIVRLRATIPGVFEIELERSHRVVGRLKVTP